MSKPHEVLNPEDQVLLASIEAGEWYSAADRGALLSKYRAAAQATLRKDRRINIRLSTQVLEALQKRALLEGLPYQTFIASLLHKFAAGRLVERG